MKPKNFPARKLLRQLNANERQRVFTNSINASDPDFTLIPKKLTAEDELNMLHRARGIRSKRMQL